MAEYFKAKLGSTLHVCLVAFISWNNSLRLVNSANDNHHVYKGKIYKIPDAEAKFLTAKAYCEEDGGTLAKISSETITDDFYAPFSQFLSRNIGEECARFGVKYSTPRGHWIWTDGTVAKNLHWTQQRLFYEMRDLLACGRLCQGDEEWKWEPADCFTPAKFVCEYEDPNSERCGPSCVTTMEPSKSIEKAADNAVPDGLVYKGKLYKVYSTETDYESALALCQNDGGSLAKITPLPATNILGEPLSQFLSTRLGDSCVFIGASDRETEGDWVWTDGQEVYLPWKVNRNFHLFLQYLKDCGRICMMSGVWKWTQDYCDISSKFLCEFDEPVLKTAEIPEIKPTTKPVLKPKPRPVAQTRKNTVVVRMPDRKQILEDPLFTTSAPVATMCSRVCMQEKTCGMFNFNMATRECRGYDRSSAVTYKENPKWEVWVFTRT